jgi:hypothetical protein
MDSVISNLKYRFSDKKPGYGQFGCSLFYKLDTTDSMKFIDHNKVIWKYVYKYILIV